MLVRDHIKRALRLVGVLPSGREPTAAQAADALVAYQSMIMALPAMAMAARWIYQDVTTDVTAEENDFLRVNSETPITIYLPTSTTGRDRAVDTCGTITVRCTCTSARAPRDGARVWITDVFGSITPRMYFYRADLAAWVLVTNLMLDSEPPLGSQFDAFLPAMLAVVLADEYDQEVKPVTASLAQEGMTQIASRFRQSVSVGVDTALLNLSSSC